MSKYELYMQLDKWYHKQSIKILPKYFDTLFSMVVEGKDDWEIINANPSYMLHLNRVRELRNLQREKEFKTKRRLDLEVHYVWRRKCVFHR